MVKVIRKNLEDIVFLVVFKVIFGFNILIDFWRGKKGVDVYCFLDNF